MNDSVSGGISAGAGIHPYLVRQVKALRRYRKPALRGEHDAVHQMRVASRRLRSVLSTASGSWPRSTDGGSGTSTPSRPRSRRAEAVPHAEGPAARAAGPSERSV